MAKATPKVGDILGDIQGPDAPNVPGRGKMSAEQRAAWWAEHQARNRVAELCPDCGRPLRAGEGVAHRHAHLSAGARALARTFEDAPPAARAEFVAYVQRFHVEAGRP